MFQYGVNIKRLRKSKGLKQIQLAEMIHVDPSLISKIERGYSAGSISTLRKIADVLGIPVSVLFEDDNQSKAAYE